MMESYESLFGELDEDQRNAAKIGINAVIAAGAGSGKTRVLAARFVHLIVKEGLPVESILALTFTRKAAAEMYGRIYQTLRTIDDDRARKAVAGFHRARISTIDSFCASIARNACRAYGVTPDFRADATETRRIAEELALPFFLEHRKSPAVGQLMKRYSMAELPAKLFAETMIKYSSLPEPLNFTDFFERQRSQATERFGSLAAEIIAVMAAIAQIPIDKSKTLAAAAEAVAEIPAEPAANDRGSIKAFLAVTRRLSKCSRPTSTKNPSLAELNDLLLMFKKKLYPEFLQTLNWILNEECIKETLRLLADFQETFNRKKREAGILTFNDIAIMAVDALRNDIDLRNVWKGSIKSIMIDEFQDDNALQKDLLFLIAEKSERREKTVPSPEDLESGKLFFVGDEKQSIYRFRGADVSVFRSLARDLGSDGAKMPELAVNYRTETTLIESFNRIFPYVFPEMLRDENGERPLYEASFSSISAKNETSGVKPALEILLVPTDNFEDDRPGYLSPADTEASEVAARIGELVRSGTLVAQKKGKESFARPCAYGDIAIIFRSGTKQQSFERQLRSAGIPYQTENVRGLFTDAPVNDLYALLRLAVYPADNTAYAMLLRSPFVGIGDGGFTHAVLERTVKATSGDAMAEPFAEEAEEGMTEGDRERFARGRVLYRSIRDCADRESAAEMVTRLWYGEGYRYALFADEGLRNYAELYDYFFELARQADSEGLSLAGFLDRIAQLMETEDKIDNLDIPVERSGGVTLMTIHKSKGLEYPVVFLVDSGSEGSRNNGSSPVYYSPASGISVNTGSSDDVEDAEGNWFYERDREGDTRRDIAEARRLLYVAMTRAETRLIVSGTVKLKCESAETPRSDEALREIVASWLEPAKAEDDSAPPKRQSFLRMILEAVTLEAMAGRPIPGVTVSEILPRLHESRIRKNAFVDQTSDPKMIALHEETPATDYRPSPRNRFSATGLNLLQDDNGTFMPKETGEPIAAAGKAECDDPLDLLIARTGMSASDFGTFAHRAIEARITGFPAFMPDELKAVTDEMAERFLSSRLGKMALDADWRESEYAFITRFDHMGKSLTVTGQMDLAFESGGKVYVIDYKTDRIEDPAAHALQLSVYRKAISDLRGKPAETWLFYLRSGNAVLCD